MTGLWGQSICRDFGIRWRGERVKWHIPVYNLEGDYALQNDNRSLLLKDESLNEGEVYPVLRRAIVELYLQPGATVSIKDICEYYKMGRSPVRDALMRLEQEGRVTLLPQRGTLISPNEDTDLRRQRSSEPGRDFAAAWRAAGSASSSRN